MGKRSDGEGTWGKKTINGITYHFYRNSDKKYFYGKTQKEVREKVKKYSEESNNNDSSEYKTRFGDFVMWWLKDKKALEIKPNTLNGYINCMNGQLLNSDIASRQLGNIKTDDFQDYYNSMAKEYTLTSIKKNYAIIMQCVKYANKHKLFRHSIDIDEIKLPHAENVTKKSKEIHFLDDEDIMKLQKEANRINTNGNNWGGKIGKKTYGNASNVIVFILNTGLRVSECIGLIWSDIDLDNRTLTVSGNIQTIDGKVTRTSTKTKSGNRIIPLNDTAMKILNDIGRRSGQEYVFQTKNHTPFMRRNINTTLNRMVQRADLKVDKLTVHELRHSFGSALLRKGIDIKIVSTILGHKDITVTYNIYTHILQEQKVTAVNVLNILNEL